jgi:hypothetical protein
MIPKNRCAAFIAVLLALPFLCPGLRAQVQLDKVDWQVSLVAGEKPLPFKTIQELKLEPYQKYPHKFRAVVTVQNASAKPVEGLVLMCALSLHMVKVADAADSGFWAVPFRTEELRISRIKAGGVYEAKLIHFVLNEQLKKLKNTGFWVDALKLQVMLDPKSGDDPAKIMKEGVISIVKP